MELLCLSCHSSMRVLSVRFFVLLAVMAGLGFAAWTMATQSVYSPWYQPRWETVGAGFERMEFVSDHGVNVLLYKFDPDLVNVRIEHNQEPGRVQAWSNSLSGNRLVLNGFYFLEDNTSAGLLISGGESLHAQTFDYDKSGVLRLAPDFDIVDTGLETFSTQGVQEAGQSYPFLLKEGESSIKEGSGLAARRTFMATDTDGFAYAGLVWRDDVSLFELMEVLHEIDVPWRDALNLDGGPSSGLVVETPGFNEVLDSAAAIPNVIVIQPK